MVHLRLTSLLKRVLSLSVEVELKPHRALVLGAGFCCNVQNPRFFSARTAKSVEDDHVMRIKPSIRKKAEAAMLDYFYGTRGLQFVVAEGMSKNAPTFLENLLKQINTEMDIDNITHSISRYLRFHPINEFEPFLESLGMKESEYRNLLPSNKMFLDEDALLLENHRFLCNYGISSRKMGKIYKEAMDVFGYETGVLASKIRAYEDMKLSNPCIAKLIVCSPRILIGCRNIDLANVLEILNSVGYDISWLEESLSEKESYDWRTVYAALTMLRDIGIHGDKLCGLIRNRPRLILESSGEWTLILTGFQTKIGSSRSQMQSFFQHFPQFEVGNFVSNLRHCFLVLNEIEMQGDEIRKILRSHSTWIGTCSLKKTGTILSKLNSGKRRICQIIQENPEEMKKWTLGSKIQQLPDDGEEMKSKLMKTKFLLDLGYHENTKEMERAYKDLRAKGSEIRERYDFIVSLGLKEKDVREMVIASPNILSQGTDLLEAKVDYLVNKLGYPLSTLVHFPSYLKYTLQRIKLRFTMCSWLQDQGKVNSKLAISTILACSENGFVKSYVTRHPDGLKHWEDLKKQVLEIDP